MIGAVEPCGLGAMFLYLLLATFNNQIMKIETYDHSLVYDLVNHMRKKGMPDEMAGYLRFLLEDNIPMHIKVDGKLYSAPWRYWQDYVSAFASCCGMCCDESIAEVERAKSELLKHATQLTDHALDY